MSNSEKRYFDAAYSLENTDQTKAHYAKWAEVYDQEVNDEKGYQQPQRCAAALIATNLNLGARILDVGCGTGLSGAALREAGFDHIDGCDLSPEMLEKAEATGFYQRLFETNLNEPPLEADENQYDAATCVGVFSFGHVAPDAIDEILRVLKPGGILLIGLNDHYYDEGSFPAKLDALVSAGKIEILSRNHGQHLANVEGSTGWVITSRKNQTASFTRS